MIKKFKRSIFFVAIFLLVWILLAEFVLCKNRMTDQTLKALFADRHVPLKIGDTEIQGHRLHYGISGHDSLPTLVFIHGSPGSWSNYRKYMWDDTLLSRFRMIGIDRPGFGFSDFGDALDLSTQSELISILLRHLSNGRRVVICGHSMGAPVAVKIAASHPDLVQKLTLVGAPLDAGQERTETWRHIMNYGPFRYLMPGAFRPSNFELLALKKELLDFPKLYTRISCDVVFIHGLKDDWVPIESIRLASQTMKGKTITIDTFPDAGHLIPWDNKEEFKTLLSCL